MQPQQFRVENIDIMEEKEGQTFARLRLKQVKDGSGFVESSPGRFDQIHSSASLVVDEETARKTPIGAIFWIGEQRG